MILEIFRSSWILNECNLYCKIVKYCILSEVCMIKTAPHGTISPQMWCIKSIKGWFTRPQTCWQDFVKQTCRTQKIRPDLLSKTICKYHCFNRKCTKWHFKRVRGWTSGWLQKQFNMHRNWLSTELADVKEGQQLIFPVILSPWVLVRPESYRFEIWPCQNELMTISVDPC